MAKTRRGRSQDRKRVAGGQMSNTSGSVEFYPQVNQTFSKTLQCGSSRITRCRAPLYADHYAGKESELGVA